MSSERLKTKTLLRNMFLNGVLCPVINFQKHYKFLTTFFTERDKNKSIKYDIFQISQGSNTENFSPNKATFSTRR